MQSSNAGDLSALTGACTVTRATPPGLLLADTNRAIGTRLLRRRGQFSTLLEARGESLDQSKLDQGRSRQRGRARPIEGLLYSAGPILAWGYSAIRAPGDSTSVTTTPLRGAMVQTHYTQFVPPNRHERAPGTKERCGRRPSYRAAYAVTASGWGAERAGCAKGHRWTIESDLVLTADQTAPSLGRAMANRVKASRALR